MDLESDVFAREDTRVPSRPVDVLYALDHCIAPRRGEEGDRLADLAHGLL